MFLTKFLLGRRYLMQQIQLQWLTLIHNLFACCTNLLCFSQFERHNQWLNDVLSNHHPNQHQSNLLEQDHFHQKYTADHSLVFPEYIGKLFLLPSNVRSIPGFAMNLDRTPTATAKSGRLIIVA